MSHRATLLLATLAALALGVAATSVASAQGQAAFCTPVAVMSPDPVQADLALEGAINDHLDAGRTHVVVQTLPPAPGVYVCAW